MRNASIDEDAARKIRSLAAALQELLCYADDPALSNRAKIILTRCYRELKKSVDYYFEPEDNPLVWAGETPGRPFTKKTGERHA